MASKYAAQWINSDADMRHNAILRKGGHTYRIRFRLFLERLRSFLVDVLIEARFLFSLLREPFILGVIAGLAFIGVIVYGYLNEPEWVGFANKSLWDWLQLLIIPVVLAIGGYLLTRSENRATRVVADRRAQDEALQAYLDHIGELLLHENKPLRGSKEDSEVRTLARARTVTALRRLDHEHNGRILDFLRDAHLVGDPENQIISFAGAYLSEADLSRVDFSYADLRNAKLEFATLKGANLSKANLSSADLFRTNLEYAEMADADLSHADLRLANLKQADLRRANLRNATLAFRLSGDKFGNEADLEFADLSGADLSGATISDKQIATSARLSSLGQGLNDATMPNGQKYEEWLKDKESRK